jgi:hypothetical protein
MSVKESLLNLGIQQLKYHYKYRNVFVKTNTMISLLEIANDIWYYLVNIQLNDKIDLALLIHEHLTDDEIKSLFWVYKQCKCGNQHSQMNPISLNSLELIDMKMINNHSNCHKACCYLHKAYHYNKYHIWI